MMIVFIDANRNSWYLASVILGIFATSDAFMRRQDLLIAYAIGLVSGVVYAAQRGVLLDPLTLSTFSVILCAMLVGAVMGLLHIRAQGSAKLAQLASARSAARDPLTGLYNRSVFFTRIDEAIAAAMRSQSIAALLYLDLDGFKAVNDRLGYAIGDVLFVEVACRLRQAVRASDVVARIGGDEFMILAPIQTAPEELSALINRVRASLVAPISIGSTAVVMNISIGLACAPIDGPDREIPIAEADAAMYKQKAEHHRASAQHDAPLP